MDKARTIFNNLLYGELKKQITTKQFSHSLLLSGLLLIGGGGVSMKENSNKKLNDETEVYSWGGNIFGQLGLGNENNAYVPHRVDRLNGKKVIKLSIQKCVSSVLTQQGEIYTWGKNQRSLLGNTDQTGFNISLPYLVNLSGEKFIEVQTGPNHMAAVTADGRLYTWGDQEHGKLGQGQPTEIGQNIASYAPQRTLEAGKPPGLVIGLPEGKKIVSASCGEQHTLALTEDGQVYSFGLNQKGCTLGYATTGNDNGVPQKIQAFDGQKIVKIDCGAYYNLALSSDGKLYSWGNNEYGQLGNNGTMNSPTPVQVEFQDQQVGIQIKDFSCGDFFVGTVSDQGLVYTWGYGSDGQLGHSNKSDIFSPKQMVIGEKIEKISCGGGHTGIISDQGKLFIFGRGRQGQLGRGDKNESEASYRTQPKPIEFFGNNKVAEIACGGEHTLAIVKI